MSFPFIGNATYLLQVDASNVDSDDEIGSNDVNNKDNDDDKSIQPMRRKQHGFALFQSTSHQFN